MQQRGGGSVKREVVVRASFAYVIRVPRKVLLCDADSSGDSQGEDHSESHVVLQLQLQQLLHCIWQYTKKLQHQCVTRVVYNSAIQNENEVHTSNHHLRPVRGGGPPRPEGPREGGGGGGGGM